MAGEGDEIKGRMKQAAGDLSGDDSLKAEGETDEAAGKAKGLVDDVKGKVNDAIDSVKGALDSE